ncbi:MAG: hypothetical protein ACPGUY_09485 [Akkermansiaceae bacterium]
MKNLPVLLSVLSFLTAPAWSQGTQAPARLESMNFNQLADYIQLGKQDENYQKITWHSTVLEGQQLAQKQDKPLLLWLYFGDPRANC